MPRVTKTPTPKTTAARPRTSTTRGPMEVTLAHEKIARRAYDLFLREGAVHGRDMDHWLLAERELLPTMSAE